MFAINRKSDFARKLEQDIQYIRLEMLMHSRAGIVHPSHENESLRGARKVLVFQVMIPPPLVMEVML